VFADAASTSPLYVQLARAIARDPELLALSGAVRHPPVANVLLAAVHARLLSGDAHPLRAFYPSCGGADRGDPYHAFRDFCLTRAEVLQPVLERRITQTNEVGRCLVIVPGLLQVPGTLALIELGSSAGLHLFCDRYHYRWGPHVLGWSESPVQLTAEFSGGPLDLPGLPPLVYRVGVDQNPLDLADDADRLWLRALVWPEHEARRASLEAAMALTDGGPPDVRRGDALASLDALMTEAPPGASRVVLHSHTWNQFTPAYRSALEAALTRHAPCWRLAFEHVGGPTSELWLHTYTASGVSRRKLAEADPHGAWVRWLGS